MQTGLHNASGYTCFNLPGALDLLGDDQGVRDLVPALCSALSKDVPEIASLLAQGRAVDATARLHSLKGFVPIFCEPVLAQEIIQLEALGRQESLESLRPRLVNLVDRLQALENDVKLWRERFERNPTDPSLFPSV